jgi:hypothetical protein
MSSLYRSAISARIAKLPHLPPSEEDYDEPSEEGDSLGELPSGMGPPAMLACCLAQGVTFHSYPIVHAGPLRPLV